MEIKDIIIDKEFKDLIPDLSYEEYCGLEESLKKEGNRDAIVVWKGKNILLDGRNRKEICKPYKIPLKKPIELEFESREDAKEWIILNQSITKRNLNKSQKAILGLEYKPIYERKYPRGRPKKGDTNITLKDEDKKVRDLIGTKIGVSGAYIQWVAEIKQKNPRLFREIFEGKKTLTEARKELNVHVSYNSGESEWYTPKKYIKLARKVMGGIDLDPASSEEANKIINAKKYFTKENDGLTKKWFGNVWLNPPYAQPLINKFSKAVTEKVVLKEINQAIVLVNNATETKWGQRLLKNCSMVCFIGGRVKFIDKEGKSTGAPLQGQMILYFGKNTKKFQEIFKEIGVILWKEEK